MTLKTQETQAFLDQTYKINKMFELLNKKMVKLGYSETLMFLQVAQKSFENEIFQIIKETR